MSQTQEKVPTFNILVKNQRVPTLIHCFLHRMTITVGPRMPDSIVAKNGEAYKVVYDFPLPEQSTELEVLMSFQKHTYGNFVILRAAHQKTDAVTLIFPSTPSPSTGA